MLLRKLGLIMWKNLLLRKRHWIGTSFEIVIPLALFILAAVIRSLISDSTEPAKYNTISTENDIIKSGHYGPSKLYYTPNNITFINQIIESVREHRNITEANVLGFDTEDDLINHYLDLQYSDESTYAIIFANVNVSSPTIPDNFTYTIRIDEPSGSLPTDQLYTDDKYGPGWEDTYSRTAFMGIQVLLDKAYMELVGINNSTFKYATQEFPYPEYDNDIFKQIFGVLLSTFTVLSFVMLCPSVMKRVVEEKETGVKELMKMMGLKKWMLWLGWMINALMVILISISIITILLKVPFGEVAVLENSDGFLIWFIFLFYAISAVIFCFTISSFFSRPTLAMSIGIFLWFITFSATVYPVQNLDSVNRDVKMLLCVMPNTAINYILTLTVAWESSGDGLTWSNFFETPEGSDLSAGLAWVMLIVDMFVYGIVTWYVESVMPGQYGLAKPWYFAFSLTYWLRKEDTEPTVHTQKQNSEKFEKAPSNLSVGIKIRDLRKVFQSLGGFNKKVAVDGVTLDIYNGEITALLGHNGAGKTTTMSILTGLYSPTSGTVHIDGKNIKDNLEKVREKLGLCPQHNLLFSDLTVMEHLLFFAMLKGSSKSDARAEALNFIERLNLSAKTNAMSSTLSGGMKRKLSLGIALVGKTKVLMLDEPTSGMDPEARREIWDLLLSMRGERTILITTHFMEEADVLGDRIAIMYHGKVECHGTSLFLKKLYGTGYQLNLLKDDHCNVDNVTKTIQRSIPDAEIKNVMGTVLSYMLPSEQTHNFPDLFDSLEREKQKLGLTSIGVSITTLEEVFLRVGKEMEETHEENNSEMNGSHMYTNGHPEVLTLKQKEGSSLMLQHTIALFKKRLIYAYRDRVTLLIRAALAIILAVLTVALNTSTKYTPSSANKEEPALTISLSAYGNTTTLFTSQYDPDNWSAKYEDIITSVGSNSTKVKTSVNEALMNVGIEDVNTYRQTYMVAAEFNTTEHENNVTTVNALFSSIGIHSAPISLNLLSNAILKTMYPSKSIMAVNHPLIAKEDPDAPPPSMFDSIGPRMSVMTLWMTLMPYGLMFITAALIKFPVTERVTKAKQLQIMSGASPALYWITCFLCDMFYYLTVTAIMLLGVYIADPLDIFDRNEELGVCFLLMLLYGLSAIPVVYLFGFLRNTSSGAFSLVSLMNVIVGMILGMVVYAMEFSSDYDSARIGLKAILQLWPHFSATYGFMHFADQATQNYVCKMKEIDCEINRNDDCCKPECVDGVCPSLVKPYLEFASGDNTLAIGEQLVYLAADAIIYVTLIMMIEYRLFEKLNAFIKNKSLGSDVGAQTLEDDVLKEKNRINSKFGGSGHQENGDIMLVNNLVKKFSKNLTAVKGVSFGVSNGECFGLLGINGAGKTTTFRMLTGDEFPSAGDAYINRLRLKTDKKKFLGQIGYCPQFDGINELLTGREMLKLFARLRGIPKINEENEVSKWIRLMGLKEYENRLSGTYSGGNKRKLSTAMALIGDPPIVFLDEPTSGVDPVARRNLWGVLTSIQKSGQSIVLTSHSMEECEALCNRLAIMVDGQFMCMGGIQYLKQKYGQGFTIMIKLRTVGANADAVTSVKSEVESNFRPGCILKDEHQGLLHYHVTNPSTLWKHLFSSMERIKQNFEIVEDYTISETTLEQVFLSFAKPTKYENSIHEEATSL